MRALTEQVVSHFALYGKRAQGQLVRKVTEAARQAAHVEPERLRFSAASAAMVSIWSRWLAGRLTAGLTAWASSRPRC